MADANGQIFEQLIVNQAAVVSHGCCACGNAYASNAPGDRALCASINPEQNLYLFCAACGDAIMAHVQADAVREIGRAHV